MSGQELRSLAPHAANVTLYIVTCWRQVSTTRGMQRDETDLCGHATETLLLKRD